MKAFLRAILHAAIGGAAAAGALIPAGAPITTKTVLFPILVGAASAVAHLFIQPPTS